MTDLESPRKNNDCYFYYYSTCTKGDNCTFRHEPSALGCETTCSFWKEGKCINVHCNFRHMELRKNRKTIPCYWESQPSGCKKAHCPFMHVSKKNLDDSNDDITNDEHDDLCNLKSIKGQDDFTAPVVDPLVVNFEEESDNESSTPTQSSHKTTTNHQSHDHHQQAPHHSHQLQPQEHHLQLNHHQQQQLQSVQQTNNKQQPAAAAVISPTGSSTVEVKTLEEIKLDRIQAESAAYYSYTDESSLEQEQQPDELANGRNRNIFKRLQPLATDKTKEKQVDIESIHILTLDEIRKRKRKMHPNDDELTSESCDSEETKTITNKKPKVQNEPQGQSSIEIRPKKLVLNKPKVVVAAATPAAPAAKDISEIKVKTLAEIKAERLLKRKHEDEEPEVNMNEATNSPKKQKLEEPVESEVKDGEPAGEQEVSSTSKLDEHHQLVLQNQQDAVHKVQCVVAPVKRVELTHGTPSNSEADLSLENKAQQELETRSKAGDLVSISTNVVESEIDLSRVEDDSKLDELLLDDEDDDAGASSLSLKAEDDILNDIDNLLNE